MRANRSSAGGDDQISIHGAGQCCIKRIITISNNAKRHRLTTEGFHQMLQKNTIAGDDLAFGRWRPGLDKLITGAEYRHNRAAAHRASP